MFLEHVSHTRMKEGLCMSTNSFAQYIGVSYITPRRLVQHLEFLDVSQCYSVFQKLNQFLKNVLKCT